MTLIVRLLEHLVTLLMGIVVGAVFSEVAVRAVLSGSLIVVDELARSLMIWTALLGAALLVREDGHVRIGLLDGAAGPRVGLVAYLMRQAVTVAFLVIVIVATASTWHRFLEQNTVTLGVSIAWVYAALPVSAAMMIVFAVHNAWRRFAARER